MWVYQQKTGGLDHNGRYVTVGYSGFGKGRNNPKMEAEHGVGPIPRGLYKISQPYTSKDVGPFAMALKPVGHDALERRELRLYGEEQPVETPHDGIVLARAVRVRIDQSGDRFLQVI